MYAASSIPTGGRGESAQDGIYCYTAKEVAVRQAVRTTAGVSEPHLAATRGRALPCQKSRMFATWRVFGSHLRDLYG